MRTAAVSRTVMVVLYVNFEYFESQNLVQCAGHCFGTQGFYEREGNY